MYIILQILPILDNLILNPYNKYVHFYDYIILN